MSAQIKKAGGIITRRVNEELQIYLIHRPRYDDWSVPKGHIDEGETPEQAAVREVLEETGLMCRITEQLSSYEYQLPSGEESVVYFFSMQVQAKSNPLDTEADEGRWVSKAAAMQLISYPSLREYLEQHVFLS